MRALTFSVDGMRCRRCVRRATALVRDVEGVQAVTADAESGLLTVRGTMTGLDIAAALRNTTFTAHLIDEDPKLEF
jgi:copper chaperone CopZ